MKEDYIVPLMTVFTVRPIRALMISAGGQDVTIESEEDFDTLFGA